MFLGQISGKLSLLKDGVEQDGITPITHVTLTERRWSNDGEVFVKHFLHVPQFSKGFVKKCIEKDWKVIVYIENPVSYTNPEMTDAGYMLYADLKSVQIP